MRILGLAVLLPFTAAAAPVPAMPYDWHYTFGTGSSDPTGFGDSILAVAFDQEGNILLAGRFGDQFEQFPFPLSADFDPTQHDDTRVSAGLRDAVLVKLSPRGEYLSALTLGGSGDDALWGVVPLNDGSVIVSGYFSDAVDFDPGPDDAIHVSSGGTDVFVSRFDPAGGHVWTQTFGGSGDDEAQGLVAHPDGGVIVFGQYFEPASEPTSAPRIASGSQHQAFLIRLTLDGELVSELAFGGSGDAWAFSVAAGEEGDMFVAGAFRGTVDFDPGPNVAEHSAVGSQDAYLCRFDAKGEFSWIWTIGSPDQDVATDVRLLPSGDPVVVGLFGPSPAPIDFDPTPGVDAFQTIGFQETFVTRLSSDQAYRWTRTTRATNTFAFVYANAVAVDSQRIMVAGAGGRNIDFAPFDKAPHVLTLQNQQGYVWALSPDGAFEDVGTFVNSAMNGNSIPIALGFDLLGNLLCAGFFNGVCDFDPGAGAAITASLVGGHDAFAVKFRGFSPSADHDASDRVDLRDFAAFQACFGIPSSDPICRPFDFNENLRIDAADFGSFASVLTGP